MKKARAILISLAAALVVTAAIALGPLFRLDKWTQDVFFQQKGVASRDIIIIGIDEEALDLLGPYNTWSRNVMAMALEALAADPDKLPAAVGIDVLYAGASNPEADERLARAAEALGNVVTASAGQFGQEITWESGHALTLQTSALIGFEEPYEALRSVTRQGHINANTDQDGVMRHGLLYIEPNGERVYSMACETARLYLESKGQEMRLPTTRGRGYFYISYTGLPGAYYDGVSIAYLISGKVPVAYWAGKIVLIGPYAVALQDEYFTSIDKGKKMFGVEIQANVIQSLLEGNYKTEVPEGPQILILFLLSFLAALLFRRWGVGDGGMLCLGLAGLSLGGVVVLYRVGWILHPLWYPLAVVALYVLSLADHYSVAAKEKQTLALENERIGAELALAARIQSNALPKVFPPFPDRKEFDLYASMTPAKEVGGDLYDFFLIDEDHLALVIADVSGKGVPAALFMMVATALIRHAAAGEVSPAAVLKNVNDQICARNPEDMFITVWLGVLQISTGVMKCANAGHEYPVLKSPNGHFELFKDRHGFVIGGMEGIRYREYELTLEKGSKVFVYTDGLPEATDAQEAMFGAERMVEVLQRVEYQPPQQILTSVTDAVHAFVGRAPQFDDLTMLCVQYNGPEETDKFGG